MHSYPENIEWLFSQLPNYQNTGENAYKPGLENIRKLAAEFGNPQNDFKSIHVAGTNGKGSVSNMLASILAEQGYKVGLFTSPHFKNFTERIKVNGKEANETFVNDFINNIRLKTELDNYSFFEFTTIMAFEYFAKEKVDFAIIETGLGGRLDATNIITPILSIITSIGLDHTQILGETKEKIAIEKAGIIKENVPVVIGKMDDSAKNEIEKVAKEKHSRIYDSEKITKTYPSDLKGKYQIYNQKTVLESINALKDEGIAISQDSIEKGLLHVKKNTGFRGRWELIQENPKIIWDTAHNLDGIQSTVEQLKEESFEVLYILMAFVEGKDIALIIENLKVVNAKYVFTKPSNARGKSPKDYENQLQNLDYEIIEDPREAYQNIKEKAGANDLLLVMGSNFLIADLIE